ncbi:hypothetical protein F4803DRAFT_485891 [Xylaria telfairii]|nr:hypothetical protein F4803DRAFT_485891 [Xylaria telfairii]
MYLFTSGSKQSAPARRPVMEHGNLYFAYGSNLHLTQMANRCPASIFKGKAVLSGYRWQINERGVANVVQSTHDSVEGLLYLVNPRDERSLDRSEGVSKGFYQKQLLRVAFEPNRKFENLKTFEVAQLIAQSETVQETTGMISQGLSRSEGRSNPDHTNNQDPNAIRLEKALVYVSENYTADGIIREEYILRTKNAMFDAEILGVSRSFVEKYVNPCLEKRNEVLSTPNQPRGGSSVSKPHGGDGSTKARTKRTSERPQSLVSEAKPGALNHVDLQVLQSTNREPHADSGLDLPADMLDAIKSARSKAILNEYQMVYVVVAHEDNLAAPRFDILATSLDLELANELAIKHFRDACSRLFPSITGETQVHWAKSNSTSTRPGSLNWRLERDICIQLDAKMPNNGSIIVQVNAQKLSARS